MTWTSGPHRIYCDPECKSIDLPILVRESYDGHANIIVGEQRCGACDCRMLFSRRLTKAETKRQPPFEHLEEIYREFPLVGVDLERAGDRIEWPA